MNADEALQRATLRTDDKQYRVARLPAGAIWVAAGVLAEVALPFSALIADADEVTLILPSESWAAFKTRLPDYAELPELYRLITFDLELPPELTGFIARVGQVLAEAGVPVLTYAAYTRDHVLVPADRFQAAWDALQAAQQKA